MSPNDPPLSGYTIAKVYSTHQELRHQPASEDTDQHGAFRFGWDWRWLDKRVFEVRITVSVEPSTQRDELIKSNVVGRFKQNVDDPGVEPETFASLQAVAILLPYARQFLSSLTTNSIHGTFYLPTLSVVELMKGFDSTKTIAAQQNTTGDGVIAAPVPRRKHRPDMHKKR